MTPTATETAADTQAPAEPIAAAESEETAELTDVDLLVEDVSIDGMCGVY